MSVYYGYGETDPSQSRLRLNYVHNYRDLAQLLTWISPRTIISGNPVAKLYACDLNHDSKVTMILSIRFDYDTNTVVSGLVMDYGLSCVKKDGTVVTTASKQIVMENYRCSVNFFPLNLTMKVSDLVTDYTDLTTITVEMMRVSGTSFGNESVMQVVIDV